MRPGNIPTSVRMTVCERNAVTYCVSACLDPAGELALLVTFPADVDIDLLHETIVIERGCCSFLTLDDDASERRLCIAIDDPARAEALQVLRSALRDGASAAVARWSR